MILKEETLESEYIYKGKILNLRKDYVKVSDGKNSYREIVEHNGAVGIICLDKENNIILVNQFRKAVERTLLEIPAGKLELKEEPFSCAVRELKEETGITPKNMTFLGEFYLSAGFSNEKMYLYFCNVLKEESQNLDDGEFVEVIKVSYQKALKMVEENKIVDAKTVLSILLAKKYI